MRLLSLSAIMVTRSLRRASLVLICGVAIASAMACDNMPLVAPTGTVITLFANSTVLPVDGSIEIIAIAVESGSAPSTGTTPPGTGTGGTPSTGAGATAARGTPVHNGTVITFTTTLGRIEPAEARTHNGQVTVRLFANGQSGVATVRAFSGGAASNELIMNVGTAAAKTVFISATPQTLSSSGGTAQISARVVDVNGTNLPSVPVTFTADNGTLSQSTVLTDGNGIATTNLNTSRETKVTATVASGVTAEVTVRVNTRIGLTITPPSTPPTAGIPAAFTIAVGSNSNVQNVRVDWGDGSTQDLGALTGTTTVNHTYRTEGDKTVSATATDASGEVATVSTAINVLPQQPPAVTITASDTSPNRGEIVTLTASVSGASSTVLNYRWELGQCSNPPSPVNVTSNRIQVSWSETAPGCPGLQSALGTKVVTVTVTQSSGPEGIGQTAVNVIQ
jgi:adhesin/invasin